MGLGTAAVRGHTEGVTSYERRPTRQIQVGSVPVGGDAPISVQSMTTTKTADVDGTLQQIYALAAAGADIVRCTCNEQAAAEGLAQIVPRSPVPIIADIHHQYKMALAAMEAGVQGLRLNPGNIRKPAHIKAHLKIFINCLVENPAFDSQTKENMTLKQSAFGSKCVLSDKFFKDVLNCGVLESVLDFAQSKQNKELKVELI